jgi:transposase
MTRSPTSKSRPISSAPVALPPLNLHAAAIDIGATSHFVAIPEGRDTVSVREFGAFTRDLHHLADWLTSCSIETVVMESTSVYVRRITARAIPPTGRMGSEGNPWVND